MVEKRPDFSSPHPRATCAAEQCNIGNPKSLRSLSQTPLAAGTTALRPSRTTAPSAPVRARKRKKSRLKTSVLQEERSSLDGKMLAASTCMPAKNTAREAAATKSNDGRRRPVCGAPRARFRRWIHGRVSAQCPVAVRAGRS